MDVSEYSLARARTLLVPPKLQGDFATLAGLATWRNQRLKTLLEHAELANYTVGELINWRIPQNIYREFVLSPVIVGGDRELGWRRMLWESFYPRIRRENSPADAAQIVARFLRQRVTLNPEQPAQAGVETIWREQIANRADFDVIYTAALRSVGVPARLDGAKLTEIWNGQDWERAPRPLFETCQELEK